MYPVSTLPGVFAQEGHDMKQAAHLFIFVATSSDWEPLEGDSAPSGEKVWEVRSLPGNYIGVGSSREEALDNLKLTLETGFERAGSAGEWYSNAWKVADQADRETFGQYIARAVDQMEITEGEMIIGTIDAGGQPVGCCHTQSSPGLGTPPRCNCACRPCDR